MSVPDHDTWLADPWTSRSLQGVERILPTATVTRGSEPIRSLDADPVDLDDLELESRDGRTVTLAEHLDDSFTEGLIVLHRGRIVLERYRNGMEPAARHLLASVTKSLTADLLGIQIGKGLLSRDDRVDDVDPRLADTSLAGATVGQTVDMTVGTDFREIAESPSDLEGDAPMAVMLRQAGMRPLGGDDALGLHALLATYGAAYAHGERFEYRTPLTTAVAGLVEAATGRPYGEVLAEDLWSRIGAERDLLVVLDAIGEPFAGGGGLATLRDLARYGQMLLDGGRIGDEQIVPSAWVDDTARGNADTHRAFRASEGIDEHGKATWALYRNAYWVVEPGRVWEALGLLGQVLRINRDAGTVIVRFSAQPVASRDVVAAETYRAHAAIERALAG